MLFRNLINILRSFIELSWMQKKHLDEIKLCSEDSPKNSLEFRLFTRKSFLLWRYEYSWIRKIQFVRLFAGGLWCYADFLCEMMFVWQMDSNQFWVGWSSEIRDLKIVSLFIWWMDALQKIFDLHRNRASHRVWLTNQSMSKRSCSPPRYDGWWWKGCWGKGMYDIVYIGEKHCLRILFVSCNTIRLEKIFEILFVPIRMFIVIVLKTTTLLFFNKNENFQKIWTNFPIALSASEGVSFFVFV